MFLVMVQPLLGCHLELAAVRVDPVDLGQHLDLLVPGLGEMLQHVDHLAPPVG